MGPRASAALSNRSAAELGQHDEHQYERDELERGGRPWVRSRPLRLLGGGLWSSGGFHRPARRAKSSQGLHPNDSASSGLLLALEAEGIDLSDRHVPSVWLSFDDRRPGELY